MEPLGADISQCIFTTPSCPFFSFSAAEVVCLALLPDGRRFISGSHDKTARIVEHGLVL